MGRLIWDKIGTRTFETGVDRGVLYPQKNGTYPKGVAWSGLTEVNESPSGAEDSPFYADNMKYLSIRSAEELGLTIGCFTYPKEWEECDGSAELIPGVKLGQQKRNTFGFSYRTKVGNDTDGSEHGYKIHLVYGCSASPSEKAYSTVNESPEPINFSYEVTTTAVVMDGYMPVASITIDSTEIDAELLAKLEDVLYGTAGSEENSEGTEPRLPMPDELKTILGIAG